VELAHFPCLSLKIYHHCPPISTKFINTIEPFSLKNVFKKTSFVCANRIFIYNFQCRNSLIIYKKVSSEVIFTEFLNLTVLEQGINISKKGTLFVARKGLQHFIYRPYVSHEYKYQKGCMNSCMFVLLDVKK
jgi:hypothetical protein